MSNHRRKESQNNTHRSARVRHLRVRIEQEEYDLRGIEARGFRELASKAILPAIRPEPSVAKISHQTDFRIVGGRTSSSGPTGNLLCLIIRIESGIRCGRGG